jgi:ABC-type glutathione transport system ATPase component
MTPLTPEEKLTLSLEVMVLSKGCNERGMHKIARMFIVVAGCIICDEDASKVDALLTEFVLKELAAKKGGAYQAVLDKLQSSKPQHPSNN